MRTDDEIQEELYTMSMSELCKRASEILTRVGAINSETQKAPTPQEVELIFHKEK